MAIALMLIVVILLILILYIVPIYYGNTLLFFYNNNATNAGIISTIAGNLLIAFVTALYVALTGILVIQSKNAIAQSKKEQQIRDIENRLEKFYIPAIDIIKFSHKSIQYFKGNKDDDGILGNPKYVKHQGFNSIMNYRYLAETETCSKFESILENQSEIMKTNSIEKEVDELKILLERDIDNSTQKLKDLKK